MNAARFARLVPLPAIVLAATTAAFAQSQSQTPSPYVVQSCAPGDVAVRADRENGTFDGMSHSGFAIVVTNTSPSACTIPRLPSLAMLDASGSDVHVNRAPIRGMNPGPVMVPIVLAPGASAKSNLRYVSGDVFKNGTNVRVATVRLTLSSGDVTFPIDATIYGPSSGPTYETTPFTGASSAPSS